MRIDYTDHLVGLIAATEASAARIAGADPDRRAEVVARARSESARASVRLDASPLEDETADAVDRDGPPPVVQERGATPAQGGWARALKLEGMATQDVAAVEYANLLDLFDAEPHLADRLFEHPLEVLREVHARICRGLVDADVAGVPRRTEQAVHDGAQGRAIYHTPPPDRVPGLLEGLCGWLGHGSATLPTIVVAAVVQERLLEWHPFEAANGRVARAASRLVLRARGLDPHGAAVVDVRLARDAPGYYAEVAATMRRGGALGPWVERYAEAAAAAFAAAAEAVDPQPVPALPGRARVLLDELPAGATVTLTEYARRVGVNRETARADLAALVRSGALRTESGSRGLRFAR